MPLVLLTPHDAPQPSPDELTSLVLNFIWRRHVAQALVEYFERAMGTDTVAPGYAETLANYHRMLLDLYDREIVSVMRFCAIMGNTTAIYPGSATTTLEWDTSETPFYFDPDSLFQEATNSFRANAAGAWALFCYFDIINAGNDYTLHIKRVGESSEYAVARIAGGGGALGHGIIVAPFLAQPGDEFVVQIEVGLLDIGAQYGYAAFVLLGEL